MEVIAVILLSGVVFNVVCILSFLLYRHFKTDESSSHNISKHAEKGIPERERSHKKTLPPKRQKKVVKRHSPIETLQSTETESASTEQQLIQTIMNQQQFSEDSINTTPVNAKPSLKKKPGSKSRKDSSSSDVVMYDPDWENVTSRKKKKLYSVTKVDEKYEFTLDAEGGLVELPFCEMHFPPESVHEPLHISMELEKYEKFVDDTEEKLFVTPAIHFLTSGPSKLMRQFTVKLDSMKMMGRGWDGNACCQIESKDADGDWVTTGRTEYLMGKPIQIVGDYLTSFRVVITRSQNAAINRDLNIAAYLSKPKLQNPPHHFLHICIYDNSQQTQYKVNGNMQKMLLKMPPKLCTVPFGSNIEFKVEPTQKYTPDDKDIFMRWTEVCKAYVNVRFQIKLNGNRTEDPNFETEFRTLVFLSITKVCAAQTLIQREYFHFYWISAQLYPKKGKTRNSLGATVENGETNEQRSTDDRWDTVPAKVQSTKNSVTITPGLDQTQPKKKNPNHSHDYIKKVNSGVTVKSFVEGKHTTLSSIKKENNNQAKSSKNQAMNKYFQKSPTHNPSLPKQVQSHHEVQSRVKSQHRHSSDQHPSGTDKQADKREASKTSIKQSQVNGMSEHQIIDHIIQSATEITPSKKKRNPTRRHADERQENVKSELKNHSEYTPNHLSDQPILDYRFQNGHIPDAASNVEKYRGKEAQFKRQRNRARNK